MLTKDVAEGIHRIEDSHVNWYIVEGDTGLTIVDAGLPTSWRSLHTALIQLGKNFADIKGLVLTHGHFDHIGFDNLIQATARVHNCLHIRKALAQVREPSHS